MSEGFQGRLIVGSVAMLAVLVLGTSGYWLLGDGMWTWDACLYMTVITLTTVGYGEVLDGFEQVAYVRSFTVVLIILGMGVFVYFASTLTAFIVEGDLRRAFASTRMRKRLSQISDHVIVCGAGSTGRHVINELMATRTPVVIVDKSQERLEALAEVFQEEYSDSPFLYVVGDATDDSVLEKAGITRASGLVAALANDKDNLYLVVSARQSHPDPERFRIVARATEISVMDKLRKAGADSAVSPNFIGGMRLASEFLRPTVVKFIDEMLRGDQATRIEEITISPSSDMAGQTISEADLRRRTKVSVLAAKVAEQTGYIYNPGSDFVIEGDMILVVFGTNRDVDALRKLACRS